MAAVKLLWQLRNTQLCASNSDTATAATTRQTVAVAAPVRVHRLAAAGMRRVRQTGSATHLTRCSSAVHSRYESTRTLGCQSPFSMRRPPLGPLPLLALSLLLLFGAEWAGDRPTCVLALQYDATPNTAQRSEAQGSVTAATKQPAGMSRPSGPLCTAAQRSAPSPLIGSRCAAHCVLVPVRWNRGASFPPGLVEHGGVLLPLQRALPDCDADATFANATHLLLLFGGDTSASGSAASGSAATSGANDRLFVMPWPLDIVTTRASSQPQSRSGKSSAGPGPFSAQLWVQPVPPVSPAARFQLASASGGARYPHVMLIFGQNAQRKEENGAEWAEQCRAEHSQAEQSATARCSRAADHVV